jgi:hypothetical protein
MVCQFYFLAHLLEMRRLSPSTTFTEFPTGYIGLYPSAAVSVFTMVSLVVFPLVPLLIGFHLSVGWLRFSDGATIKSGLTFDK